MSISETTRRVIGDLNLIHDEPGELKSGAPGLLYTPPRDEGRQAGCTGKRVGAPGLHLAEGLCHETDAGGLEGWMLEAKNGVSAREVQVLNRFPGVVFRPAQPLRIETADQSTLELTMELKTILEKEDGSNNHRPCHREALDFPPGLALTHQESENVFGWVNSARVEGYRGWPRTRQPVEADDEACGLLHAGRKRDRSASDISDPVSETTAKRPRAPPIPRIADRATEPTPPELKRLHDEIRTMLEDAIRTVSGEASDDSGKHGVGGGIALSDQAPYVTLHGCNVHSPSSRLDISRLDSSIEAPYDENIAEVFWPLNMA
ncbi:hypothetical protein PG993_006324 [Apiospora rasikravindrae]|uniref:Uncharacterized protein n=1 Tax=Apiospora rasikravindrae TaxID=990691 RepID=A0ABR1T5E2_9PEZI